MWQSLVIMALWALTGDGQAAPQKAEFTAAEDSASWPLEALEPSLPRDWSDVEFLVLEFRASSSQPFELGFVSDDGLVVRRVFPFAQVWVRAAIPLRLYRPGFEELAPTGHLPRAGFALQTAPGGQSSLTAVRAITATLRFPAQPATLEIRKVSLARTDPGDAVLAGAPLVDDWGQYRHAEWPGKARTWAAIEREWAQENRMLAPKTPVCRFGGWPPARNEPRRQATGFFRVEAVAGRWWLVDPEGCRFWLTGVNDAGGESPWSPILGRSKLFASIPTAAQLSAPGAPVDPLRDPVSFHLHALQKRFGENWREPQALLTARRLRTWGLNTVVGASLQEAQPPGSTLRLPYVLPLRGWQQMAGAVLGMPDVYTAAFAQQVERDVARELGPRRDDPWMLGYFIGDEPAWLGRESLLVDRVLAGPASELQKRFRAGLARGDTPAARRAVVFAAFARYLEVVNATARRQAPRHLNLGMRFGEAAPPEVLSLARSFDVLSLNQYRWAPARAFIERAQSLSQRPVLISGFHFGTAERGLSPGRVPVLNQSERGVAYSYFVESAAAQPAIVGTVWSQWVDQPATGRWDGQNYQTGWVDVTDRPYPELVAAAKATHGKLEALHSGKISATTRRARAAESGTPEDPQ